MKYKIGTHIWVIHIDNGVIYLHDDWIDSFSVEKNKTYYLTRDSYTELAENEIILYADKGKLHKVLCEKMSNIRKEEGKRCLKL